MTHSIFGQVVGVRKFATGEIEIDFYHEDEITEFHSSSDSNKSNLPLELAETLIPTLASDICVEIHFDDTGRPTHMELEECDYDDEEMSDD